MGHNRHHLRLAHQVQTHLASINSKIYRISRLSNEAHQLSMTWQHYLKGLLPGQKKPIPS